MSRHRNFDMPPPDAVQVRAESDIIRRVRARDESTISCLFKSYYAPMLRAARTFVRTVEEAEEVIQDTWLAVLSGIDRFAARSSFKTWIFRILVNTARTRARRESRSTPFSQLPDQSSSGLCAPDDPEQFAIDREIRALIDDAITQLPPAQQRVFVMSDVEGWPPADVCSALKLSHGNQRVLLHRSRSRIRQHLAPRLEPSLAG